MNIYEIINRFSQEVEKYQPDPVLTTVIEDYVNYAYQYYITEKYDSLINPEEKFEVTERISRILAPLIKDHIGAGPGTPVTINGPNGVYVAGPDDLQYIIKESAIVNYIDCNGIASVKTCKVIPIKHNMISSNIDNPFLKPSNGEIWRVNIGSNNIELILYPGVTLNAYMCRYLKKHLPVSFNPVYPATGTMEIDSSVHEEVVLRAVLMYLADLRNQKEQKEDEE